MPTRLPNGFALPTALSEARFRSTNWIRTWDPEKWKTFWGALPTASIADAPVEDLPRNPRCEHLFRRGCAALRRALEQSGSAGGLHFAVACTGCHRDFRSSRTKSAAG